MKCSARRILLLTPVLLMVAVIACAQDDVIRVDTRLVAVPVTVLDRDGRYLAGLKRQDFRVFENGVEQSIDFFGDSDQPVTVLMLLDRSGSMIKNLQQMAGAAGFMVGKLRPDDQLLVATFADRVEEIVPRASISQIPMPIKVRNYPQDRGTLVYDAVGWAIEQLRPVQGRKAIILFSDGISGDDRVSRKDSLKLAEQQDALIYTVRFALLPKDARAISILGNEDPLKGLIREATGYMDDLAAKTGGRSFFIEQIDDLGTRFGEIAAELRQQYTLGYYPTRPGRNREKRKIAVTVNRSGSAVRARKDVTYPD
jgi:Ca-activated chloride channel homolog